MKNTLGSDLLRFLFSPEPGQRKPESKGDKRETEQNSCGSTKIKRQGAVHTNMLYNSSHRFLLPFKVTHFKGEHEVNTSLRVHVFCFTKMSNYY